MCWINGVGDIANVAWLLRLVEQEVLMLSVVDIGEKQEFEKKLMSLVAEKQEEEEC